MQTNMLTKRTRALDTCGGGGGGGACEHKRISECVCACVCVCYGEEGAGGWTGWWLLMKCRFREKLESQVVDERGGGGGGRITN